MSRVGGGIRINFNPRTHVGCDIFSISPESLPFEFQSTHPRGVRQQLQTLKLKSSNFNPRTHVGCDINDKRQVVGHHISIHAPTWGATAKIWEDFLERIFQSTHPRGVRRLSSLIVTASLLFQSTHPRGVRPRLQLLSDNLLRFQSTHPRGVRHRKLYFPLPKTKISIHAPTWGATFLGIFRTRGPRYFNPRTHVGCDTEPSSGGPVKRVFQSTHPRGVRRCEPCRGGAYVSISIHAPTWGATSMTSGRWSDIIFQSTHPRGVRLPRSGRISWKGYFNPRTHVGCDGYRR